MVDRSTMLPREMVEDVLIKVGEFTFPFDFVMLEVEVLVSPKNEIPVILGQLFLATSNALISYRDKKMKRDEKMKLTFRNVTMKLNVFNLQTQPMEFDDLEHPTLNWVGDFSLKEVEFEHDEELMLCAYV